MKLKYLLITFIFAFISACNVAEQGPKVDTTESASKNTSVNLPNPNQVIKFRKDRDSSSESGSFITVYLEREGTYLPDDQIINIKIGGSADLDDLDATNPFVVDSSNVTFLPGSTDTFEVKFPDNTVSQDIKISFNNDNMFEQDEVLQLQIVNNANKDYVMEYPSMMGILIENDDNLPEVKFPLTMASSLASPVSVNENNLYSITVELSNNSYEQITVPVRIHGSSVANSQDHTYVDKNFIIPPGQPSETFNFTINDDLFNELDELLVLEIGTPINAVRGNSDYMHYIRIVDTTVDPTYDISAADGTLGEAGDTEVLTLTLNMVAGQTLENALTVPVTITPTSGNIYKNVDYQLDKMEFTFPAGSSNGQTSTITVTGLDDGLYEQSDETIQFTVSDSDFATAGTSTTSVTITDDEAAPVLQFISPSYLSQEGATFYLPINISTPSDEPIILSHTLATGGTNATPGDDHSILSELATTFTIPAGATSYQHPIMIYSDSLFDQNETIAITLAHSSGHGSVAGITTSTITIKEDGTLPSISFDTNIQSSTEDSVTPTTIGLTMSGPSEYATNVTLTIQDNSTERDGSNVPIDYNVFTTTDVANCSVAGTTITILAGSTTCDLSMILIDDTIDEPTEQFELKIQQPSNMVIGTYPSHVINILDGDVPPELEVSFDPTQGVADVAQPVTEGGDIDVYFHLSGPSGYDIIINYDENPQTAEVLATDYKIINPGTIVIPEGSTTAKITVQTYQDNLYESGANEQVAIQVASGTNYDIAAQDEAMIDIVDEDSGTPPTVSVAGLTVLETNENDIVNISFELSKPTAVNTVVEFEIDDSSDCATLEAGTGDFEAAIPNSYYIKCANIDTDPTTSESQNLLSQISGGIGEVTIPAGSTQGVLSFKIDTDNLFENSIHTTGGNEYIRKEQFRVTISDLLDSSGGSSIDGVDAQIDADDYVDIRITDLDVVPVAFYANPFFKSQNEAATTLSIPINVTSMSETDITYHIQIIQQAEPGYNLPDENDFDYTLGVDPVVTTFGNLEPSSTDLSEDDTVNTPAYPNSGLLYTGANNIIFEGQFTIPALQTFETLVIELLNDNIYEGNEQFIVKIVDDPNEATYNWGISLYNDYKVTILESSSYPTVSLSSVPASTIAEGTHAPTSDIVDALTAADPNAATDALDYTNAAYEFTVTPISQHNEVSIEFLLSGTAVYNVDGFDTPNEYMQGDYFAVYDTIGATGANATDFTVASSANSFTATIPAGTGFETDEFNYQIAQDYKYEPIANTIITTVGNLVNVNNGAVPSHTITLTDDDAKPYLYLSNISSGSETFQEYEKEHEITMLVADSGQNFIGGDITEVQSPIDFTMSPNYYVSGVQNSTVTINLDSSNNYTETIDVNPNVLGDFRALDEIDFLVEINPVTSHLQPVSAAAPYSDGTQYDINWDFEVQDLKVAISRGGTYKNSNTELHGHICTLFRGQVSCAGQNDNGQLGRGNITDWGGAAGELVYDQSNVIDLGNDSYGNPNYAIDIALGTLHTCIVLSTNEVKCWGDNQYAQLGAGLDVSTDIGIYAGHMGNSLPTVDLGTTETIVSIHAGYWHTCVLFSDNNVKCWGRNANGELGTNNVDSGNPHIGDDASEMGTNLAYLYKDDTRDEFNALRTLGNIEQIVAGGYSTCLRDDSNYVYCWGFNSSTGSGNYGRLGRNLASASTSDYRIEKPVVIGRTNLESISAGGDHFCANYSTGSFTTRCWGSNTHGQLGTGAGAYYANRLYILAPSGNTPVPSYGQGLESIGMRNSTYRDRTLVESGQSTYSTNYSLKFPSDTTFESLFDLGVTNNQFVQVEMPGRSIAGSGVSTCGVYDDYYDTADDGLKTELHVRCWGSNVYALNSHRIDAGLLSNRPWSMWYPSSAEDLAEPIVSTNGWVGTDSCDDDGDSAACRFVWRRAIIGDDNWWSTANTDSVINTYVTSLVGTNTLNGEYEYGWAFTDDGTLFDGAKLNFELNTEYAKHKVNFDSYDDVELVGGNVNICALPKESAPTIANNKLRCWGANWAGQVGVDLATGCYAGAVGGRWSCGVGRGQTHEFNYTYSP